MHCGTNAASDREVGFVTDRWYREAVIYCVQVDLFVDSNGDGCGDLRGLISRLDYAAATAADARRWPR